MGQQDVFLRRFWRRTRQIGRHRHWTNGPSLAENAFFEGGMDRLRCAGFPHHDWIPEPVWKRRRHIGGTGGYIAGIRQNPHGAVGAVEPIADAVAGIVGCGKGGDTECAHKKLSPEVNGQQRRNTGKSGCAGRRPCRCWHRWTKQCLRSVVKALTWSLWL